MTNTLKAQIDRHQQEARIYLHLASDNHAVAMYEDGSTPASLNRMKEYLGYAEDYSLLAHKEMTKAYLLIHKEMTEGTVNN